MAIMEKVITDDGRVQMRAEFIDHLFSMPASIWTGCLGTIARTPMSWYEAWEEMCGIPMRLETAKQHWKLERYSTDRVLVAQERVLVAQQGRWGYRLTVLALNPYRIIDVQQGTVDRASAIIWEEV